MPIITKKDVIRLRDMYLEAIGVPLSMLKYEIEGSFLKSISPAMQLYFNFPRDGEIDTNDLWKVIEVRGNDDDNGAEICQKAIDMLSLGLEGAPLLALVENSEGKLLKGGEGGMPPQAMRMSWASNVDGRSVPSDCQVIAEWLLTLD